MFFIPIWDDVNLIWTGCMFFISLSWHWMLRPKFRKQLSISIKHRIVCNFSTRCYVHWVSAIFTPTLECWCDVGKKNRPFNHISMSDTYTLLSMYKKTNVKRPVFLSCINLTFTLCQKVVKNCGNSTNVIFNRKLQNSFVLDANWESLLEFMMLLWQSGFWSS